MKSLIAAIFLFSQIAHGATLYRMSLDQAKPLLASGKFISIEGNQVELDDNGYEKKLIVNGVTGRGLVEKFCDPSTLKHTAYLKDQKEIETDKEVFHCFVK